MARVLRSSRHTAERQRREAEERAERERKERLIQAGAKAGRASAEQADEAPPPDHGEVSPDR